MTSFEIIFNKIIILFIYVVLGWLGARKFKFDANTIANILFYFITPVVFFHSIYTMHISISILMLLLVVFLMSCGLSLFFYYYSKNILKDNTRNILSYAAGAGNSGYFGLPLVVGLFEPEMVGIYVICMIGMSIYENSLGFFLASRGKNTIKDSLISVAKLPSIHAFILGCIFSYFSLSVSDNFVEMQDNFVGAYSIFGMMLVGIGFAGVKTFLIDYKFLSLALLQKFIIWPLAAMGLIALDHYFLHFYDLQIYQAVLILSVVPLPANTVVLAAIFNNAPEKCAYAVLVSTLIAVVYLPIFITYLPNIFALLLR